MFTRADVRLVCYRMKKNAAIPKDKYDILEEVEKVKLPEDSWEDFSTSWDVFVSKNSIQRIVPETDEVYLNNTCIEIKTKVSMGVDISDIESSLNQRQKNIYDTVKLNYLGDEVNWLDYNESWVVKINNDTSRIEVINKNTKVNKVVVKPVKTIEEGVKEANKFTTTKGKVDELDPDILDKIKAFLSKDKE